MALLALQSVDFSYGKKNILNKISVQLNAGEMVGLVGSNGVGKSTLLQLIMGSIKPQSGKIVFQQQSIATFNAREWARKVSLVPQSTDMGHAFRVDDVVAMGRNPYLRRFQTPSPEDLGIIKNALKQTDLDLLADRHVHTLSGGERQRVLVARSIAQQTSIILFDEATANLDICHQLDVFAMATQLAKSGRLVICAIHDLNMAARFCDRLLLLADTQIQADGTPEAVLTTETLNHYFSISAHVHKQYTNDKSYVHITPVGSLHSS